MFLSVFDMFKISIGPSSSHTMGPMLAAARFLELLRTSPFQAVGLRAYLHGSLAFTGVGHATDRATILGLDGFLPDSYDAELAQAALKRISQTHRVQPADLPPLRFDPAKDMIFDYDHPLAGHPNGMILMATDAQGDVLLQETYFSIGGGFVVTEAEQARAQQPEPPDTLHPYPFETAETMLKMAASTGKSIAEMKRDNELVQISGAQLDDGLKRIWRVMEDCITRGLASDGILPGGLNLPRRAHGIFLTLQQEQKHNLTAPHTINDWICTYAMAVNEENAAGGQVVTAPTNGAAGVLPAVMRYWLDHVPGASPRKLADFLLTAGAIGGLIKHNASISGAEAGCQAEIGSASAMAAAGLCAVLGGSPQQVENAAEIALEHHLGMTCDPVKGLVQVPCIERNGLGAIKAVTAASLALRGDGQHFVPLDACIETMRQTGRDMSTRYKETSLGGLAVNIPNC
ncbi:MAG: L-serine ammonia-lyase [Rhodobacterales bacterium]|nr:MAG: L-serine ammonia-lyase [Rhodobacterales bacterium]